MKLTKEETEQIDRFLAGETIEQTERPWGKDKSPDSLYTQHRVRAEKTESLRMGLDVPKLRREQELDFEKLRQEKLAQYFRVLAKAFNLQSRSFRYPKRTGGSSISREVEKIDFRVDLWEEYERIIEKIESQRTEDEKQREKKLREAIFPLKPWKSKVPVHFSFIKNQEEQAERNIDQPETRLGAAIYQKGIWKLLRELDISSIAPKLGLSEKEMENKHAKLVDILDIKRLKNQLKEARETGDLKVIFDKEIEIAGKIQTAVSKFGYGKPYKPSSMLSKEEMNCIGFLILGGSLFSEVGIKHLPIYMPNHAATLVMTTVGRVFLQDMQMPPSNNIELKDEYLEDKDKDKQKDKEKQKFTLADIVKFSNRFTNEALIFNIKPGSYPTRGGESRMLKVKYVEAYKPEIGHQVSILMEAGCDLLKQNRYKEAVKYFQEVITLTSNCAQAYSRLGECFMEFSDDKLNKAIELHRKAIRINPQDTLFYSELSINLVRLKRYEEAIEASRKAIEVDPQEGFAHFVLAYIYSKLGNKPEASRSFYKAGNLFRKNNQPEYAIEAFEKCIVNTKDNEFIKRTREIIEKLKRKH